ncbi:MAG: hypothetical protein EBX50_18635, partial [Chitinophagia bacterium]|nr:hypothetical protein [Chitinophagia bacterium]
GTTTTGASIVGGLGDDQIIFTATVDQVSSTVFQSAASNTYFFGANGGKDTLNFDVTAVVTSGRASTAALTFYVDSSYGATSNYSFTSSTSLITFGTGASSNSVFVQGITGTATNNGSLPNTLGFTFTTVASSVITALG